MADGADLSPTPESVTTSPEAAPLPPAEPESYQPLSLLAIAAFGIAVLYAAIVLIGGLLAMFTQTRWLLPLWTLVLPGVALGMGCLAGFRIRRSEGTLGGIKVANWAIGLSVCVGMIYGMYYLGTFFAVRTQAQTFADMWLKKIVDGKIADAFFETTKPPRKIRRAPEDADDAAALRRTLELDYNTGRDNGKGMFTTFSGLEYVRLLQAAGSHAKIEATGVKDWDYEKGGFTVTLTYRVTTDLATIPLQVKVLGAESRDFSGRQWQVIFEETGMPESPTYTDAGNKLRDQILAARFVANRWVQDLAAASSVAESPSNGKFDGVHLANLTPEQRKTAAKFRQRYLLAGLALGPVPAQDAVAEEYLGTRQRVLSGGLVRIEDKVFWSPNDELRQLAETETKALFNPGRFKHRRLTMLPTAQPVVTRDEQRIRFGFDVQITTPRDDPAQPQLYVEGRVIVGAYLDDLAGKDVPLGVWRIEALELVRGRNAAPPPAAGAAPRR